MLVCPCFCPYEIFIRVKLLFREDIRHPVSLSRSFADVVRKYFGDEPDMERLDDVLSKAADKSGTFGSSGKESPTSKVQSVP